MNKINFKNGQTDRIANIKAEYANSRLSNDQYNELIADEEAVRASLRIKYAAGAVICLIVGIMLLAS